MKNDKTNKELQNDLNGKAAKYNERKPYHKPKLLRYGGLAELVQRRPGRATDGGALDCTLT